jgi:hypothetical protein
MRRCILICRVSLTRDIRHDLPHLHGLARGYLLNTYDDLVIRCARSRLEYFPQLFRKFSLAFQRTPRSHEQRERCCGGRFACREATTRDIVLKNNMHSVLRNTRVFGMQLAKSNREICFSLRASTPACVVRVYSGMGLHSTSVASPPKFVSELLRQLPHEWGKRPIFSTKNRMHLAAKAMGSTAAGLSRQ